MKPDLSIIEYNLSLSPTKRLEQHQASLQVAIELNKAHEKLYAKPKSTLKSST